MNENNINEACVSLDDVITGLKNGTMSRNEAVSILKSVAPVMYNALRATYSVDPEDVSPIVSEIDCSKLNEKADEDSEADSSSAGEVDPEYEKFKTAFNEHQESLGRRSTGGLYAGKPQVVQSINYPADVRRRENIFGWNEVANDSKTFFEPFVLGNWFSYAMQKVSYTLDMRNAVSDDVRNLMAACGGTIGDYWKINYGCDGNEDHFVEIQVFSDNVSVNIKVCWLSELVYNSRVLDLVDEYGNPSGVSLYNFIYHVNPVYISGTTTSGMGIDETNLYSSTEMVLGMFLSAVARATLIKYNQSAKRDC